MKQSAVATSVATFICVAMLPTTPALATPTCGPHTTKGTWVYTCEGTLPAPAQTNTRILGSCNANRQGYFNCQGTVNLGGLILPQTLQGQANTAPSCSGTISYVQTVGGQAAPPLDIVYVVADGGNTIQGLPTNSGGVLSCTLKRIDRD